MVSEVVRRGWEMPCIEAASCLKIGHEVVHLLFNKNSYFLFVYFSKILFKSEVNGIVRIIWGTLLLVKELEKE